MTSESGVPANQQSVLATLAGAMMISGLSYFAVAPFIALYVVMATAFIGLVWAFMRHRDLYAEAPTVALFLAIASLGATLPFVWHGPDDLVGVVIFLPLLIAPGVAALLHEDGRWITPYAVPLLALIGVFAALGGGMFEYYISNGNRVGMGNNPIHFGGIAVILGYVAFTGVAAGSRAWRVIFVLGPVAGLGAAALSGSRGPLLAWAVVALVSIPFLAIWFWRSVGFWIVAAIIAQVGTVMYFTGLDAGRAGRVLTQLRDVLSGGGIEGSDTVRAMLYRTGWEQFLASPVFGHGYSNLMAVAGPRLTEMKASVLENLHSDPANLAVVAGSSGLLAYLAILIAPLLLLTSRAVRSNRQMVLACVLLPLSYAMLGATNAMFGMLGQTVLYGLLLGILIAQARNLRLQSVENSAHRARTADALSADLSESQPLGVADEQSA